MFVTDSCDKCWTDLDEYGMNIVCNLDYSDRSHFRPVIEFVFQCGTFNFLSGSNSVEFNSQLHV